MDIAVVVPVRAFDLGKTRLAEIFSPSERELVARTMAETVVHPRGDADWLVVCDDDRIASWATGRGARPIRVSPVGLNASLDSARPTILSSTAARRIVIAHADLPLADRLVDVVRAATAVIDDDTVLIAPDHRRDGSNVVALPRHLFERWEFRYGPDSFDSHCAVARSLGVGVEVLDDPRLSTDVDTVDDLDRVRDFLTSILPDWTTP